VVRRELAAALGLRVAAAARREHHGARLEHVLADPRAPTCLGARQLEQRRVDERVAGAGFPCLAQLLRDRVAGAVADL
jgi:hypothetical protein